MEFGVGIKNVNSGHAIFNIVDDEAIVVDVVEGFPFNRDQVVGAGGKLFGVFRCSSHFFGIN
jgi:hypothetical protein